MALGNTKVQGRSFEGTGSGYGNQLSRIPGILGGSPMQQNTPATFLQLQQKERKDRAIRRWKKIRDRLREVIEERKMIRQESGWELLVSHIKQVKHYYSKI